MHRLSVGPINVMRKRLEDIRMDSAHDGASIKIEFEKIATTWDKIKDESQNREREAINRLTVDHELELNDIKKYLITKDEEIDSLKADKFAIQEAYGKVVAERDQERLKYEKSIGELMDRIAEMEKLTAQTAADKQKAVNDIKEQMNRDHKTEIESLRSRFKLMTNMERSPSDTSLEKIERPDYLEITTHDLIHVQMPTNPRISSLGAYGGGSPRSPTRSTDMFRHILEDKEHQLDELRNREQMLMQENLRYKETIQTLAESEQQEQLRVQVTALQSDKIRLEKELATEKGKRIEMESSVTVDKAYVYNGFIEINNYIEGFFCFLELCLDPIVICLVVHRHQFVHDHNVLAVWYALNHALKVIM